MIRYIKGDATCPQARGLKLVAHVCNDAGKMGAGFALAVSERWPVVRELYLRWYAGDLKRVDHYPRRTPFHYFCWQAPFALGAVQFVQLSNEIIVCNMVAQHGLRGGSKGPPIRYGPLGECLSEVAREAVRLRDTFGDNSRGVSVHMPRIGCGLAGGRWEEVGPIVERVFGAPDGVDATVYDFAA